MPGQQLDPRMLMQAAMQGAGGGGGASIGAAAATPSAAPGQAAPQPSGPSQAQAQPQLPATADTGMPQNTGNMSNVDLSALMGSGSELGQDPNAFTQMVQILQDPSTPPDQKAAIQARLQLAAMRSLGSGQGAAQGAPSS